MKNLEKGKQEKFQEKGQACDYQQGSGRGGYSTERKQEADDSEDRRVWHVEATEGKMAVWAGE